MAATGLLHQLHHLDRSLSTLRDQLDIWKVLKGGRPTRHQGDGGKLFTDTIRRSLEFCWKPQSGDRLSVEVVLRGLGGNPLPLKPTSNADGVMTGRLPVGEPSAFSRVVTLNAQHHHTTILQTKFPIRSFSSILSARRRYISPCSVLGSPMTTHSRDVLSS